MVVTFTNETLSGSLPGLSKDVALAVGEVGLKSIVGGNCSSEIPWLEQWQT